MWMIWRGLVFGRGGDEVRFLMGERFGLWCPWMWRLSKRFKPRPSHRFDHVGSVWVGWEGFGF
jgi:hypothetical protein